MTTKHTPGPLPRSNDIAQMRRAFARGDLVEAGKYYRRAAKKANQSVIALRREIEVQETEQIARAAIAKATGEEARP